MFKFYDARISTDISTVISDIDNLINNNNCKDLEELLKLNSNAIKASLRRIYSNYYLSKYNNSKHNQSSLCLYHAPIKKETPGIHLMLDNVVRFGSYIEIHRFGIMLTGDSSLKTKTKTENYDDFIKRYIKEVWNTGSLIMGPIIIGIV